MRTAWSESPAVLELVCSNSHSVSQVKVRRNAAKRMQSGGEGRRLHRLSDRVHWSGWEVERKEDQLEQPAEQDDHVCSAFAKKQTNKQKKIHTKQKTFFFFHA